ncbi:inositol-tetrakisphosphate 1-kinase-like isoform X2 [Anthonomus grandis grandis]|uniref:inositol-tetrakisphosphate 1-kinase-like isoform X2 n=1 Tax=Anthonomus grandis grandis TaxID=2921223 RepID=UPI0021661557|nr:inositol-tetrakisphosphate 1-kinase-like isoform X2 [Anthonomus grandis grandis]
MPANKRIAVWMSEKKLQKINWNELVAVCSKHGFEVFKLDLNRRLEEQGPFCVLLHKLTDIIASASQGDIRSTEIINDVEAYLAENPSIMVLDPIPNVRRLLDRYVCYSMIHQTNLHSYGVFTPNFCVLRNEDLDVIKAELRKSLVTYPFICKPILGHAHEMSIIFDEKYLVDCKTPCVAQSFINHDAILYKIFIVGERHCYVERPSLKNFQAGQRESIHFDTSDVSKADSKSRLSVLDPDDVVNEHRWEPDPKVMDVIANTLRKCFGMDLLGVDVVIEKTSGRYAIIDVNAYPDSLYETPHRFKTCGDVNKNFLPTTDNRTSYDGFSNFFEALLECISKTVTSD